MAGGYLAPQSHISVDPVSIINGKWSADLIGLLFLSYLKIVGPPAGFKINYRDSISGANKADRMEPHLYYSNYLETLISIDATVINYMCEGEGGLTVRNKYGEKIANSIQRKYSSVKGLTLLALIIKYDGNLNRVIIEIGDVC